MNTTSRPIRWSQVLNFLYKTGDLAQQLPLYAVLIIHAADRLPAKSTDGGIVVVSSVNLLLVGELPEWPIAASVKEFVCFRCRRRCSVLSDRRMVSICTDDYDNVSDMGTARF